MRFPSSPPPSGRARKIFFLTFTNTESETALSSKQKLLSLGGGGKGKKKSLERNVGQMETDVGWRIGHYHFYAAQGNPVDLGRVSPGERNASWDDKREGKWGEKPRTLCSSTYVKSFGELKSLSVLRFVCLASLWVPSRRVWDKASPLDAWLEKMSPNLPQKGPSVRAKRGPFLWLRFTPPSLYTHTLQTGAHFHFTFTNCLKFGLSERKNMGESVVLAICKGFFQILSFSKVVQKLAF